MSARLAAGWARSRFQSVSVVPMIQWLPHGMTNSTLFSVRLMSPTVALIRSRGTTRWMPLDARTLELAAAADHLLDLVGPYPGGVDRLPGPDLDLLAAFQVADDDTATRSLPKERVTRALGRDHGAVARGGAGEHHRVPRVVDLRRRSSGRPRRGVPAQAGKSCERAAAAEVPRGSGRRAGRPSRRRARCRSDVRPLPAAVLQRVEERHRPGQVRGEPGSASARAPRSASRTSPKSSCSR